MNLPRSVLDPFETWLQSAVAASRNELRDDWQEHYLVAPIWRFWIGSAILGVDCAGSLVPSVDKVGRFFPLTILYCADSGQSIVAPAFDPQDAWYSAIEQRLLGVLQEDAEIDVNRLADGLNLPESAVTAPEPQPAKFKGGFVWQGESGMQGCPLPNLMAADYWASMKARSFWWTSGGSASGQLVYARNGLPDPFFYTNMIKGRAD